jgi:hypothetical protein
MRNPDLHFTTNGIEALTHKGTQFLVEPLGFELNYNERDLYQDATNRGLHVSFDTAETRDRLATIKVTE